MECIFQLITVQVIVNSTAEMIRRRSQVLVIALEHVMNAARVQSSKDGVWLLITDSADAYLLHTAVAAGYYFEVEVFGVNSCAYWRDSAGYMKDIPA